jgi:hypothetical protein
VFVLHELKNNAISPLFILSISWSTCCSHKKTWHIRFVDQVLCRSDKALLLSELEYQECKTPLSGPNHVLPQFPTAATSLHMMADCLNPCRHLGLKDALVHADLQGAAPTLVKNHLPAVPISPLALSQAGTATICRSKAWDSKTVTSAWWVHSDQVSKTLPNGDSVPAGAFSVKGGKNFLPPTQLVMGFTVLFCLGADSLARHKDERKIVASSSAAVGAPALELLCSAPGGTPAAMAAGGTAELLTAESADGPTPKLSDGDTRAALESDSCACDLALDEVQAHAAACLGVQPGHNIQHAVPANGSRLEQQHKESSHMITIRSCSSPCERMGRDHGPSHHDAEDSDECQKASVCVRGKEEGIKHEVSTEAAGLGDAPDAHQVQSHFERFACLGLLSHVVELAACDQETMHHSWASHRTSWDRQWWYPLQSIPKPP